MIFYIDPTEPVFCRNCGSTLEPDEIDSEINGRPSGMCSGCRQVTNDYHWINDYDEFDEYDDYGRTYTCETCGGEYGDGWSTCTCDDDEPEPTCRVCGCTDDFGCPGGCHWVEPDLCSQCVGKTAVSEDAP